MDRSNEAMLHRRIKVAIVDDDDSVCRALCRLFRQLNIDSERFSSGPEFMESLARSTPDWVMLDFWMPQMTGWEILSKLNTMHSSIRTIVMSGDEELAADTFGSCDKAMFMAKPIDQKTLLTAIGKTGKVLHPTQPIWLS